MKKDMWETHKLLANLFEQFSTKYLYAKSFSDGNIINRQ